MLGDRSHHLSPVACSPSPTETKSPLGTLFNMAITTESTSFTKDVQGRYLCNDFGELAGPPFDFIVVGGGTFGAAIAEHLWFRQKQSGGGLRTLVLEGGPY